MELVQLLGQANRELGRLDMYSECIPNVDLFIRMHVLKEATQSSKIEGTQTNMDEIAGVSPASAYKLIADLERLGILKEITGGQRGRTYMFADYVKLFR